MRAAKVQASLRIRAVSPEPSLLAHTSCESRGTFRQKARSLAPLNGWACAVNICHDAMLEDTNSLGGAQLIIHWHDTFRLFSPAPRLLTSHSVADWLTSVRKWSDSKVACRISIRDIFLENALVVLNVQNWNRFGLWRNSLTYKRLTAINRSRLFFKLRGSEVLLRSWSRCQVGIWASVSP